METSEHMPLEGIRILEVGSYVQAPVATRLLADFGAEVIKIEQPGQGDGARGIVQLRGIPTRTPEGVNWLMEHNLGNKKSIAVDLKVEEGRSIVYKLAEKSDVFIHNYRASAIKRMGLDYETLCQHNPRLIYANGSGYGPKGPDAERIGYDYLAQARSGLMAILGEPDNPPFEDINHPVDVDAATLLALGILLALIARDRYGIGQQLDVSLLVAAAHHLRYGLCAYLLTNRVSEKVDRRRARDPLWNHYQCADGKWIALAMIPPDRYWRRFCDVIGAPELKENPAFADVWKREENRGKLIPMLDQIFATKAQKEWLEIMSEADLGYAPVNTFGDFCNDPQMLANNYLVNFDHPVLGQIKVLGPVVQLAKTPGKIRSAAPEIGQHTEEVLLNICGYTWKQIENLRNHGAI